MIMCGHKFVNKSKITLLLLFIAVGVDAADLRSILSEVFGDKKELSKAVIDCKFEEKIGGYFSCDQDFEIRYRGDYRLFLAFSFREEYAEGELKRYQDLSKDKRETLHKDNVAKFIGVYMLSDTYGNIVTDQIEMDLIPTSLGATLRVFRVPGDLKTNEKYRLHFEIPSSPVLNVDFNERYNAVNLVLRRLSSISR